jgi:hypothetical protein
MSDSLSTIAFRARLLEQAEERVATAQEELARWPSLYGAVQALSLAPGLTALLHRAWLSGIVTAVETLLTDTLLEVLTAYPAKLGRRQLTIQDLTEAGSYPEAIQRIARRAVNELAYATFSDYLAEWQKLVGLLSQVTPDQVSEFAEVKATRDVYVHSNGKPNEVYERRAGTKARRPDRYGKLEVDEPYLAGASRLAAELIQAVGAVVVSTFPRCTKVGVFEDMWKATCCGRMVSFDQQWEVRTQPHHRKDFAWPWSSSEKTLFDVFLRIFHGHHSDISTDIEYALYRWSADTAEGQIIRSWMSAPFHL